MDVQKLKKELSLECLFLKGLRCDLQELKYDLECCPETEDLHNRLQDVKKLSGEIREIIEGMEAIKHMAEI